MGGPQRQSRYQVRTAAAPAWATDDRGTLYLFDGLCFSRYRPAVELRADTEQGRTEW